MIARRVLDAAFQFDPARLELVEELPRAQVEAAERFTFVLFLRWHVGMQQQNLANIQPRP